MKYEVEKLGYKNNEIIQNFAVGLEPGEILGLVAPNGKGKSTLFKGMMNRLPINESTLEIDNQRFTYPINSKQEAKLFKFISIMPDQTTLVGHVSGLEHLKLVKDEWKSSKDIDEIINLLSMNHYIKKKTMSYSLGMKQRLCFAMHMMMDTKIMLMDEVMNGLDIMNVELISNILKELKKSGKIIIIASHLLGNLMKYSDKVLFIIDKDKFKYINLSNNDSDDYLKITLIDSEEIFVESLKRKGFTEEYSQQYIKKKVDVSINELISLFNHPKIKSINLSKKTLIEIYYELYMKGR
ncbi:ABC transporter ATP-binding protein [Aerococcaceae bacterium zg-BR9]|uniref:ATP-binding cassette domain-containing protein n=1 Tax=Aerococcaceae bacterium zg-1292 TaxID=2774330 RepID=UPI004063A93A|nr:ABC transporter ATP-binding protein [Aerococcaceae bacterium zg-BR9]